MKIILGNYANIKLPETTHPFPRFYPSELQHNWLCSMKFYMIYFNITQPAQKPVFPVYAIVTSDFVLNSNKKLFREISSFFGDDYDNYHLLEIYMPGSLVEIYRRFWER